MPRFGYAMSINSNAMSGVATEKHVRLSNANDRPRSAQVQPVVAIGSRPLTRQAPVQPASHAKARTPSKARSALPSFQSGAAAAGYGSRHGLLRAPATSTAGPWLSKRPQRGAGSACRVLGGATSAGLPQARPNPSLKLTRYGRHCKPGLSHSHYRLSPGLQYLPTRAA
jgi:hypothetical protein